MNNVIRLTAESGNPECKEFIDWFDIAKTKDKFKYFTGAHICGAGRMVGRIAFRLYESGHVTLFQKRIKGTDQFEYWAQKLRR